MEALMSNWPFRFVHASDFHLERPVSGVSEIPDHLRDLFLEASYTAAKAVFETVLIEDASFLVLSGDIVHPLYAGPRGITFLCEQFAALAEHEIAVYWIGGTVDPPDQWPSSVTLPGNVRLFPRGRVDEFIHQHDGVPIARILGTSLDKQYAIRAGDFQPDPSGLLTVAAAHGNADPAALQARGIDYWALGGRHERVTITSVPQVIHYCGSPQGRHPEETGVHGCTLAQVDDKRQIRTCLIPTDALRLMNERVVVDKETVESDLQMRMRERIHSLRESAPKQPLLITWTIAGGGPLVNQLQCGRLAADLLESLRGEFGHDSPAAWSLAIEVEPADRLPEDWYEQETIRGDFLREIRRLQMNIDEPMELDTYICEAHRAGSLGAMAHFADKNARQSALSKAALLGSTLLGGDQCTPHTQSSPHTPCAENGTRRVPTTILSEGQL
jgi:DNA repair protein SbcD/Mre11